MRRLTTQVNKNYTVRIEVIVFEKQRGQASDQYTSHTQVHKII